MATTEAFGYTYPEISTVGQNDSRKGDVIAQINRLYGGLVATRKGTAASITRRDWFVNVQVERADLSLPCSINVYLGNHFAGRTALLNMPASGRVYDELTLLRAIDRLGVDSNDSGAVERALMKNLHVKVVKVRKEQPNIMPEYFSRAKASFRNHMRSALYIVRGALCAHHGPSPVLRFIASGALTGSSSADRAMEPRSILRTYRA
jgi:hypothetical protein